MKADCLQCSGSGEERYPEEEDRIFPCYVCGGEGKVPNEFRMQQDCEHFARSLAVDFVQAKDAEAMKGMSEDDRYAHLLQLAEQEAESHLSSFDFRAERLFAQTDRLAGEIHSFLLTCPASVIQAMSFVHQSEVQSFQDKSPKQMNTTCEPKLTVPYNPNDHDDLPF